MGRDSRVRKNFTKRLSHFRFAVCLQDGSKDEDGKGGIGFLFYDSTSRVITEGNGSLNMEASVFQAEIEVLTRAACCFRLPMDPLYTFKIEQN